MDKEAQATSIELSEFGSHAFKLLQQNYKFLKENKLSGLHVYTKQILERQLAEFHESLSCELAIYKRITNNSLLFQELEITLVNIFLYSDGDEEIDFDSLNLAKLNPMLTKALYQILLKYVNLLEMFVKDFEQPKKQLESGLIEEVPLYMRTGRPVLIKN